MINGAGKQAIKNRGPRVTNSFPGQGARVGCRPSASLSGRQYWLGQGQIGVAWGLRAEKMNIAGWGGYGGNRTLTLSRHNPCHRRRRAVRSSPTYEGGGVGAA